MDAILFAMDDRFNIDILDNRININNNV